MFCEKREFLPGKSEIFSENREFFRRIGNFFGWIRKFLPPDSRPLAMVVDDVGFSCGCGDAFSFIFLSWWLTTMFVPLTYAEIPTCL